MGLVIPCIKGKMGTTEYYLSKMKAGALINTVGFASDLPEWNDNMDVEERIQREIDETRIIKDIVPYIVDDPDRFFAALVVDVYKGWEDMVFESLSSMTKLPNAYLDAVKDVGFITIPENQMLICLDGQHRLRSLAVAIKGWTQLKNTSRMSDDIKKTLKPNPDLVNEDISIIIVPHDDTRKIRKIFNKINRYAKATSRGDNLITSEDDLYSIICRRLMKAGEPLDAINGQDLVNWKSNTLSTRSNHLTTISAVYSFAEELLKNEKLNPMYKPNDDIEETYTRVAEVWISLLDGLTPFQKYKEALEGKRGIKVSDLRVQNLLLKPATQMAVAIGIRLAEELNVDLHEIVEKLDGIPWEYEADIWQQILVVKGTKRMMASKQAVNNAGRLIGYLIAGERYSQKAKDELKATLIDQTGGLFEELPEPIKL